MIIILCSVYEIFILPGKELSYQNCSLLFTYELHTSESFKLISHSLTTAICL